MARTVTDIRGHLSLLIEWSVDPKVADRIKDTGFEHYLVFSGNEKLKFKHSKNFATQICNSFVQKQRGGEFVIGGRHFSITLEDVMYITGLPVVGDPISTIPPTDIPRCQTILGVEPPQNEELNLSWLRNNFQALPSDATAIDIDRHARAYILYVIGCVIYPMPRNLVKKSFLFYVKDIDRIKTYAWGAALLAVILDCLHNPCKTFWGDFLSVVIFFLERVPKLRKDEYKVVHKNGCSPFPLMSAWVGALYTASHNNHAEFLDFTKLTRNALKVVDRPYKDIDIPESYKKFRFVHLSTTIVTTLDKTSFNRPDLAPHQFGDDDEEHQNEVGIQDPSGSRETGMEDEENHFVLSPIMETRATGSPTEDDAREKRYQKQKKKRRVQDVNCEDASSTATSHVQSEDVQHTVRLRRSGRLENLNGHRSSVPDQLRNPEQDKRVQAIPQDQTSNMGYASIAVEGGCTNKDVRDMRPDHVTYQQKACQSQPQVRRSNEVHTSFVGDASCIAERVRSRKSQKAVMLSQMKKKRSMAEEETDTNIPLRASKKLKHKPIKIVFRNCSSAAIGGTGEGMLPKLTSPVRIEDSPVPGANEADHPCQPIQAQEKIGEICNPDPPMMMDATITPERNGPEAPVLPDFQEATQVQASNQPQPSPRKSEAERQKDQRDASSTSEGREIRQENVQRLLLLPSETNKFQDSVLPEAPVLPDFQETMQVQASNQPHPSPSKFKADKQKDQMDASHISEIRVIREEMVQKLLSSEKNDFQDSVLPGTSSLGNSSCNVVAPIGELTPAESFSLTSSTMSWASTFDDVSSTTHVGYWGIDGKMVKVGNYFVEQEHSSTMEAIIKKYGDIAKDFQNSSTMFRSYAVRGVCEVVVGLQIPLRHLSHDRLDKYLCFVKEAAEMGLSVKWLEERLAQVSETIESLKRCKHIKDLQRQNMRKMEHLKERIGLLEIEKMKGENEVESLKCLLEAAKFEVRKKRAPLTISSLDVKLSPSYCWMASIELSCRLSSPFPLRITK